MEKHVELTGKIIGAFYDVYNALGYGFLEKVYENALAIELRSYEFDVEQQKPIRVFYRNEVVGEYFADLIINDTVLIETKSAAKLIGEHEAQIVNYLKASKYEVGLLLNFGPRAERKRKIYDNHRKPEYVQTNL